MSKLMSTNKNFSVFTISLIRLRVVNYFNVRRINDNRVFIAGDIYIDHELK